MDESDGKVTIYCQQAEATLLKILSVINETHAELIGLALEEPNLERVFLHLTGRALRD